jgi:hypothetical protein
MFFHENELDEMETCHHAFKSRAAPKSFPHRALLQRHTQAEVMGLAYIKVQPGGKNLLVVIVTP